MSKYYIPQVYVLINNLFEHTKLYESDKNICKLNDYLMSCKCPGDIMEYTLLAVRDNNYRPITLFANNKLNDDFHDLIKCHISNHKNENMSDEELLKSIITYNNIETITNDIKHVLSKYFKKQQ